MAAELTGNSLVLNNGILNNVKGVSGMLLTDIKHDDQITSCDSLTVPGFYQGQNLNNAPTSGWITYLIIPMGAPGTGGNLTYPRQLAFPLASSKIYSRYCQSGTWSNWVTLHS